MRYDRETHCHWVEPLSAAAEAGGSRCKLDALRFDVPRRIPLHTYRYHVLRPYGKVRRVGHCDALQCTAMQRSLRVPMLRTCLDRAVCGCYRPRATTYQPRATSYQPTNPPTYQLWLKRLLSYDLFMFCLIATLATAGVLVLLYDVSFSLDDDADADGADGADGAGGATNGTRVDDDNVVDKLRSHELEFWQVPMVMRRSKILYCAVISYTVFGRVSSGRHVARWSAS